MLNPLPTAGGCRLHDVGLDWEVVRVPLPLGLTAMAILGTRCGAVLEHSHREIAYYFVPRGTAADWAVEGTEAVGEGLTLTIPPSRRTEPPGPYWRVCPGDDGLLTPPGALKAALEDAGRRPVALARHHQSVTVSAMRECARPLLKGSSGLLSSEDLETITLQLRGHLMVAIPAVEEAAAFLPEGDVLRACALAGIREARTRLEADPGHSAHAGSAYAQRLARSVNALCDHLENLRGG